jgi:hypothetical protein
MESGQVVPQLIWSPSMAESSHISWRADDGEAALRGVFTTLDFAVEELSTQMRDHNSASVAGIRDTQLCVIAPKFGDWSFLLLPLNAEWGDEVSLALSRRTKWPVVIFREFDQDAWGFNIFKSGELAARFWNRPDIVEVEPGSFTVPGKLISELFSVDPAVVAPYLQHLRAGIDSGQVFHDDEFTLDNHWVRCDFMNRLGMTYPDPGSPGTRYIKVEALLWSSRTDADG